MKKLTVSHSVSEFFSSPFNTVYQPKKNVKEKKSRTNIETDSASKKSEKYITYDEYGNFVEVEMAIEVSALSFSIIQYVKKNYKNDIIKEASEIIETNGTIIYKAVLNGLDLFFDSKSNFIESIKNQVAVF